jgi:shikimate dehydrogenase
MIKLALIGYPLGHSLSPIIHDAALRSCGLDGSYSLFPIHPDDKQGLKDLLARVRKGDLAGLNVTIPHKENVIPLLDELTPTAEAIGAVNTIYLRGKKLIGENTDAPGFLSDLKRFLTTVPSTGITLALPARASVKTQRHGDVEALVFGAGGSARAIIFALANEGWNIALAARRSEQAEQLAAFFTQYKLPVTNFQLSTIDLPKISLIVNTTPVGMTPNVDQSPWLQNLSFPPHAVIYDLVYNPRETKLVREAWAQGLRATTGLGMLIEQAALAFEIWTGRKPSREVLFDAVNQTTH